MLTTLLAAPELNEIVVVNDGSQDGTAAVARGFSSVRTLDMPENRGKGVLNLDGRMVELLHAEMAQRTVAIADAINAAARR